MVIHIVKCKGYKKLSLLCAAIKHASEENAWIAVGDKETALLAWLMAKELELKIHYPIVQKEREPVYELPNTKAEGE